MDERRKKYLDSIKQLYRGLVPLDKRVNGPYGPFPVKENSEFPLVGIDMSDEESTNEDGSIGKTIEYEDYYPEDTTPEEVSHLSFLIKSTAFGNLSRDEENFDENRTLKQIKMEEVNPTDVSDLEADNTESPENPENPENTENPRGEEEEENH